MKILKVFLSLLLVAGLSGCASSSLEPQGRATGPAHSGDRWKSDAPDVLNFKIGTLQPSLKMDTTASQEGGNVNFEPMAFSKTFVGLGYRNLGFTLTKSNTRSGEDREKYGSGDSTDLVFQFFGRSWTQQYFYQSYSGYYVSNTLELIPAAKPDTYIQRPDIKTAHYGVNLLYNFQPGRFSPAAAYNQSGRQLESGGAWLGMISVHNHKFSARPVLLPIQAAPKYKELATLQEGDLMQVSLAGGGAYSWIPSRNWFVTGQLLLGAGVVYQRFETEEYLYTKTTLNNTSNLAVSFGYNGQNNYVAFQMMTDSSVYPLPEMNLQLTTQQVALLYGHRFEGISLPWADHWSAMLD